MFSKLHDRLGTAGFVVAIVALVAALAGTAFAAAGLTGKQKNEVTAIAKKYAGKKGAKGAAGPAGAPGTNGTNGKDGSSGTNGADGKSVALTAEATGTGNCEGRGGTKVEVEGNAASKKYVCNGKEGSPWTAGGTLPSGETEMGAWAFGPNESPPPTFNEGERIPLSFTIPLEGALTASQVHFINPAGEETLGVGEDEITEQLIVKVQPSTKCLGTVAEPSAEPGHLCVYAAEVSTTGFPPGAGTVNAVLGEIYDPSKVNGFERGASVAGGQLAIKLLKKGAKGWGTWAVTAE